MTDSGHSRRTPRRWATLAIVLSAAGTAFGAAACDDCASAGGEGPPRGAGAAATAPGAEEGAEEAAVPDHEAAPCDEAPYGDARLGALYAVQAAGDPAMLTADVEALLSAASTLTPLLEAARQVPATTIPRVAREVVVADAWGAAARLRRHPISSQQGDALGESLRALMGHFALSPHEVEGDHRPPPVATRLLHPADGWAEFDTEHSVLTHERVFGLRRAFRIFIRGDHEARALVSQLIAIDREGKAYLTTIAGEVELLELDADGPTAARVLRLDRRSLGCGDARLEEEREVQRIPDVGADGFLLDLLAPESLATMPCARCHEDADAFSLPTRRTAVSDRLTPLLRRAEADAEGVGAQNQPTR